MLLVTSDIHLSSNPRDRYRHAFMDRFLKLVKNKKPTATIILGDLTEDKDRHEARLVNDVCEYLELLATICPVYVLQGNHDYVADPDNGFWRFLSGMTDLECIVQPCQRKVITDDSEPYILQFLPHTRDYEKDWADWRTEFGRADWIFCHNTFDGAIGNHGVVLDGIPLRVFPDKARVVSGDVHRPQRLGCVTYVGAPYTVDFGDDYEPRILEIDGLTYKSIKVPGPQKRLIKIDHKGMISCVPNSGDIVKIEIELDDRTEWPDAQGRTRQWAKDEGYIIDSIRPKMLDRSAGRTKLQPQHKRSDEETVKQYCTARNVGGMVLDEGVALCHE